MKHFILFALAAVFGLQTAQAQKTELGLFNHVGLGLSLGTDGIGFDVAAPVTDYAAVRAGMSLFPSIKHSEEVNIRSNSASFTNKDVDVEGKLNIKDFKFLIDLYPSKYSSFHFTTGAFIGSKKIVTAHNNEPFLAQSEWGVSGVMIGDYRITSDMNGDVEANIEVNGFKPYIGIGFGRAVPKKSRVSVSCDFGVKFWGKPGIGAMTTTNFGEKVYKKIGYDDLTANDDEDLRDALEIAEKIIVYPVLNIRINGRIF